MCYSTRNLRAENCAEVSFTYRLSQVILECYLSLNWSVHISWKSCLCLLHNCLEGFCIAYSELCQCTAIEFDACKAKTLDEAVVRNAFSTNCNINTGNPQLAEVTLASLTVAEVVVK